eukprot:TRINITY_DN800_c0_g2_i1.p1 TRINITY_DN800_c0_g2~~TRINITY_DN800_c0_g2_i1.p1  ORF type:complete len:330 (+),score=116.92 TRINITY_DN800_c0_g2_i1:87-992(+)
MAGKQLSTIGSRYEVQKQIGDGSYGVVVKALQKETGDVVAIKKMKRRFATWQECMELREIRSLKKLSHTNIVKLREVIRENEELYFVFEFCEGNVFQTMKAQPADFTPARIKSIASQLLTGLAYMHKHGFFHRDLKPENLLLVGDCIKIADFGLAREIRARPPFTQYVSTRWYRAPEVLLRSNCYNSPIDLWACGLIITELYTQHPLFPGTSESDMLFKICGVLGTPTAQSWPEGMRLAGGAGYQWPQFSPVPLTQLIPNARDPAAHDIQVLEQLLQWDPNKRPTAHEALQYPFFHPQSLG